ncbi:hypothetical protein JGZ98_00070 [Rummeliibacillus suwonensis]|nr:hypothetical protein [Rummeliibacillus suwonensis]
MEEGLEGTTNHFDKIEQRLDDLQLELRNNQTENRSHFKHIESRLEQQQHTFQIVADELKNVKIDIDYLSQKTGIHDMEINNLKRRQS